MRIVAISDTHNCQVDLPEGDLLIHCGDALRAGNAAELKRFDQWLGTLKFKKIIFVAGNHDIIFQEEPVLAKSLLTNAHYLQDEAFEFEGLKIYGTPWTVNFYDWAFMGDESFLGQKFMNIPPGLDILITHSPPAEILDIVPPSSRVGSQALRYWIDQVKPKIHVFGHIHESYGYRSVDGRDFYNCAIVDANYRPVNAPIIIEI
jgi:Icc-related predicted phosphoesterase